MDDKRMEREDAGGQEIFSSASGNGNPDTLHETEQKLAEERQEKVRNFQLNIDDETLLSGQPENAGDASSSTGEAPSVGPVELPQEELSSYSSEYAREAAKKGKKEKPPRKAKRKKKNGCLYAMIYGVVICLVTLFLSQFLINGAYDLLAVNREERDVVIEITPETTNDEVVQQLVDNGVIKEPFFYRLYAKLTKAAYRPGTYTIQTDMDYEAIINALQSNKNRMDTVRLVFREGLNASQIGQILEEAKVCSKEDFLKEVNEGDFNNYSFIKAIENKNERAYALEGYLFPDTYDFYLYEDPKTAIKRFLNNTNGSKLTAERYEKAEELGMTMDQIITLASIIQMEAGTKEDMAKVSSVFHNRLKNPDKFPKLESNATDYYPYTKDTMPEGYKSKYDTYEVEGLPVGPICNPGLDAINAALNPAKTNYFYFVMDVNGKAYYASTLSQHEKNIQYAQSVPKAEAPASSEAQGE